MAKATAPIVGDKLTWDRIEQMHPKLIDETKKIYGEICEVLKGRALCRFAYTVRTFDEQNALFAQGRTKLFDTKGKRLGVVTNARGGQSYHNYRLALDIVLLVDKNNDGTKESASWETAIDFDGDGLADWSEVVNIFKKYRWTWGGDWGGRLNDKPHFEKTFGYTWKDLLAKHNAKDFIPGTTIVNI